MAKTQKADISGSVEPLNIGSDLHIYGAGESVVEKDLTVKGVLKGALIGSLVGNADSASIWRDSRTIELSGDASASFMLDGSANIDANLTLAATGVTPGSYGAEFSVPTITVDGKGRVLNMSLNPFSLASLGGVASTLLGAVNGVATLGADRKLTASQIPDSLLGANVYRGVWNAATNMPALADGVGVAGVYYKVSVAGTTSLGGHTVWSVGDFVIYNGTVWDAIDGTTSEVLSVAGRTGVVVIGVSDVVGLQQVAKTGAYADLSGKPYIPIKVSDLANDTSFITSAGVPVTSVFGRIGAVTLTAQDINTAMGFTVVSAYILPAATALGLGGIKQGNGVTIQADGTLSANVLSVNGNTGAVTAAQIAAAATSGYGFTPYANNNPAGYQTAAQVGASITAAAYVLPVATPTVLGGVKQGANVTIAADGTISVPTGLALGATVGAALAATASAGVGTTAAKSDHVHPYPTPAQIGALSANQPISVTGDATGNGVTAITLTLANVATAGTYGSGTQVPSVTINAKGLVTGVSLSAITPAGIGAISIAERGVANGVALLDSLGKLATGQIPTYLLGAMRYMGVWNAATNTPALNSGIGSQGQYYKVSVSGSTNIDGVTNWTVGDMVSFNGTTWDQIQGGSSDVSSVFGRVGAVTLTAVDVTGALGYTPYNATNPAGYLTSAGTIANATTAVNATNATYLSTTQQLNTILGKQASMAMVASDVTPGSLTVRATGTGDANLAGMSFYNDAYALKLGVRADGYFGLGGWSRVAWSWYSDPSGNMVAAGNVTAYSDPRLKENFLRIKDPHWILSRLDGGTFTWKSGIPHTQCKAGKNDYGVLADQVKTVMPEIVTQSIELGGVSYDTVDYSKITPVLIEASKDHEVRMLELEETVVKMKSAIELLLARVQELESRT